MEKIFIQKENGAAEISVLSTSSVSDGFHTFGELYDHRITLFIALGRLVNDIKEQCDTKKDVWRSKAHHPDDEPMFDGWFVLGLSKRPGLQITYHLPLSRWDEVSFAETLDHAPKWDGHTPADVLKRLKQL